MTTKIFLARQEEQKKFREVLGSMQPKFWWLRKYFPTLAKLLLAKKESVSTSPHIFLWHGEGGMGKTTLRKRFCEIAKQDFENRFEVLELDWEDEKNTHDSLKVEHEQIRPEATLEVIYQYVSKGRESFFEKYRQVGEKLKQIEDKVDKELQARQGEGAEYAPILKQGLGFVLGALRKLPNVESILRAVDAKVDDAITDAAVNALVGLMKKQLSLEERRIFAAPQRQLAEALGQGLLAMSASKPLVLLLDTYEIVDRIECDRVLRMVIKAAGQRVVWAIAGRANLADSYRTTQDYFRGYRDEFSENLYVYPMSEFSWEQVSEYFAHLDVPLSDEDAKDVKQFSLGIPLALKKIAVMRQDGIALMKILKPQSSDREDSTSRANVVEQMHDRFLWYCSDKGDESNKSDKRSVYAIAMMRRPDNDLLCAMLGDDSRKFERDMESLKSRHSFVWLDGKGIRLDDKVESFLQEHLLGSRSDGQSQMVKELSDHAITYLDARLCEWQKEFTDTADFYESDRIANLLLDLVQFKFWQDVEVGWRYAVPLFVESWQYNRDWQRQLLGIIETFQVRFDSDSKKRLRVFSKDFGSSKPNADSLKEVLDDLEKLAKRGWFDYDRKDECMAIILLHRVSFLCVMERYSEALQKYFEAEKQLPKSCLQLSKNLSEKLQDIRDRMGWEYYVRIFFLKWVQPPSV